MIRLIASDLDGTLLHPTGQLPPDMFDRIRAMNRRGVRFAAASGRPFGNVRKMFAPVETEMDFICENGALVVAQGKQYASYFPRDMAEEIIRDIQDSGMELYLSVPEQGFGVKGASQQFVDEITRHLSFRMTFLDDPRTMADRYIKITGYHPVDVAPLAPALQKKWGGRVRCDIAGQVWLDFTLASKATGIRTLAQGLGVSLRDAAAFGDQFNDETMLSVVGHPFIMAHAPAPLLQKGFTPCESVLDTIDRLLAEQE